MLCYAMLRLNHVLYIHPSLIYSAKSQLEVQQKKVKIEMGQILAYESSRFSVAIGMTWGEYVTHMTEWGE